MAVESGLRQRLAKLARAHGIFWQSIESSTNPGMPDSFYCYDGKSGWYELKHLKEIPKREDTALFKSLNHGLRIEQENWFELFLAKGGRAHILVGYGHHYYLVPGALAAEFNSFTMKRLAFYEVSREYLIQHMKSET